MAWRKKKYQTYPLYISLILCSPLMFLFIAFQINALKICATVAHNFQVRGSPLSSRSIRRFLKDRSFQPDTDIRESAHNHFLFSRSASCIWTQSNANVKTNMFLHCLLLFSMMANGDHHFSVRGLRHFEPKISNVGSRAFFLITRTQQVLYTTTTIPWNPGSMTADAVALHHHHAIVINAMTCILLYMWMFSTKCSFLCLVPLLPPSHMSPFIPTLTYIYIYMYNFILSPLHSRFAQHQTVRRIVECRDRGPFP